MRSKPLSYTALIKQAPHLLIFGFLMTFSSSLGQTFFIGAFGPSIQNEFKLSHSEWGSIYMIGTVLSAACLPWTGQLIDRFKLKNYTFFVFLGLCASGLFISIVPIAWLLIPVIFCLRQSGQGLTSHIAVTTMAKYFSINRGKSIAIAALGYAVGESFLPLLVVLAISVFSWRQTYGIATALLFLIFFPLVMWLLSKSSKDGLQNADENTTTSKKESETVKSWTRQEMLCHWRFYLIMPAVIAPSFIGTALFFHHLTLADAKGWSAIWITGSYWVYAVGSVAASLFFGPLIDRISAVKAVPLFLIPKIAALLIIWNFSNPYWAWPYLLLLGLNVGMMYTGITALWAELYGPKHLGSIRSFVVAITVLASALGPPCMGFLIDGNISVETICFIFASYCTGAAVLIKIGLANVKYQ